MELSTVIIDEIGVSDTEQAETETVESVTCDHCGAHCDSDELTETYDNRVCADCLNNEYVLAEDTGNYIATSEAYYCANRDVYYQFDDDLVRPVGYRGAYWHEADCYRAQDTDDYATPEFAQAHWYYSEIDDAWYEDYENTPEYHEENNTGGVYPYDTDVMHILTYGEPCAPLKKPTITNRKSALYVGVELEIQAADEACLESAVEVLNDVLNEHYGILKRDASIGENGVEIVTRPSNFVEQAETFKRVVTELEPMINEEQVYSYKTGACGLHVHVSRGALTQLQIGKLQVFLNSPENTAFVDCIAQRKASSYHSRNDKLKVHEQSWGRYVALNTTNHNTIEFRIFRGTLKLTSIYKSLEFVEALLTYTAPSATSIADATSAQAFLRWLDDAKYDRRKRWPNLVKYLEQKGFLSIRKQKLAA